MPNLYLSLGELKATAPDSLQPTVTKYDAQLLRLLDMCSRWVDNWCRRVFYPSQATRFFNGSGRGAQWVDDLLTITSVHTSDDDGQTYSTLDPGDYIASEGGEFNSSGSYSQLVLNANGTLAAWPCGQRSVKVIGVWAYADNRSLAWQSTGDTVEDNPLTAAATSLKVNDVDGLDLFGAPGRFQAGQLLRIGDEYVETALPFNLNAETLGIVRACNGSAAAEHLQNVAIDVWRPPAPVQQAVAIQAFRQLQRGLQGFGDARSQPDIGQMFFLKSLDPEALALLAPYRWLVAV
jgi:hypothetical protein